MIPLLSKSPAKRPKTTSLLRLLPCLRNEVLDITHLPRQCFTHPLHTIGGNQHIVFDTHADSFVLFQIWTTCRLKLVPVCLLPAKRQIVERIQANVNAGFIREHYSRFKLRAATYVM